jgi:hypothetical protein
MLPVTVVVCQGSEVLSSQPQQLPLGGDGEPMGECEFAVQVDTMRLRVGCLTCLVSAGGSSSKQAGAE